DDARTREVGPRHSSYEAGEQSERAHCGGIYRGKRSGAGGAKGGGQGECAPAKHALDSEPGSRVTGAGAYTACLCRHTPEVGAVCGKAVCTVLCGGRDENRVPTATAPRVHHAARWRGCRVSARGACAAAAIINSTARATRSYSSQRQKRESIRPIPVQFLRVR